jgi:hypothetical protein
LLSIYANCGDIETMSMILSKMENGQDDGMPSTNIFSYISIMEGCGWNRKITEAEELFNHARKYYVTDLSLYNSMLSIWKCSGDWKLPSNLKCF